MPISPSAAGTRDQETDALSDSQIYRDYQQAFLAASGLPLALRHPDLQELPESAKGESPFCMLMAQTRPACEECLALQGQLAREARLQPKTLKCFAGLCESAAPVRVGDRLIAFLHTGHVLTDKPTKGKFSRIAKKLLAWGADVDLKKFEDAYFHTRVLTSDQYESFLRLLEIFAQHLALCSNQILLQTGRSEPASVEQARFFIAEHHDEELSLKRVAAAVNLSAGYFSELFRKSTGLNFSDYLARVRIEQAKNLLQNPAQRITDIAFRTGFGSLSQFNRTFKRICGQSPQQYRTSLKKRLT